MLQTHPSRRNVQGPTLRFTKTTVTRGLLPSLPPPPSARLPRRLCTGAAARAAAGSHGVPDPENTHAHTAWGLGVVPELRDKSIKSLWAQRCPWPPHRVPGWRGVGGAARQPAILAPAAALGVRL
uniref:Uncharacterized protein n=1 Tax=Myotis myotis TaxID=51298 RepID=A0A7J7SS39_MYOMY|nr:hypothetical protein mMyoMyo1_009292 [Myotis myotis]